MKNKLGLLLQLCILFLTGEILYSLTEILWRGYTHVSMALTGGLCLVLLFLLARRFANTSIWFLALPSALVITAVEFCVGCFVNLFLGLNIWDYSGFHVHLLGQICLVYSAFWVLLSVPALALCRFLDRVLFARFPSLFGEIAPEKFRRC